MSLDWPTALAAAGLLASVLTPWLAASLARAKIEGSMDTKIDALTTLFETRFSNVDGRMTESGQRFDAALARMTAHGEDIAVLKDRTSQARGFSGR